MRCAGAGPAVGLQSGTGRLIEELNTEWKTYGYNEGQPVSAAECDALVPDLLAAFNLVRADQPKA